MGCVPRKTWILKSWLGAESRWCVCVCLKERERLTYVSSVVCFCLCLYTDFLMKPLATEESAGNCPAIYILVSVCVWLNFCLICSLLMLV